MTVSRAAGCACAVLIAAVFAAAVRDVAGEMTGGAACKTDSDCSLNGVCTSGACVCDAAWTNGNCSMLAMLPAKQCYPDASLGCGFFEGEHTTTWGGSIIKGGDGRWYMLAAEMANNCSLGTWTTNSQVVVAVAQTKDDPTGPYTRLSTAVTPWAHNPEVIRAADGTYVLFTLGNGTNHGTIKHCGGGQQEPSAAGAGEGSDRRLQSASQSAPESTDTVGFTLHYAKSPTGPWMAHNTTISGFQPTWNMHNWNPAPVAMPDGSVRMMVHTDPKPWAGETVVEASTWRGPYKAVTGDISPCDHCEEDPFMWKDKRGNWHVLYHRMFDPPGHGALGSWSGGHSFSADGLTWSPIDRCYNTTVALEDGSSVVLKRRERPKLVFDKDGQPTHLSNGVERADGITYTLVVPLAT